MQDCGEICCFKYILFLYNFIERILLILYARILFFILEAQDNGANSVLRVSDLDRGGNWMKRPCGIADSSNKHTTTKYRAALAAHYFISPSLITSCE